MCAAYLAKAGRKVLVLEAGPQAGGLGATREFAPGFRASVADTLPQLAANWFRTSSWNATVSDWQPSPCRPSPWRPARTLHHLPHGLWALSGSRYRASYQSYLQLMQKFAEAINPFWHKRPPVLASGG